MNTTENKSRAEKLDDFLDEIEAIGLSTVEGFNKDSMLKLFSANGKTFIVVCYYKDKKLSGFDIYIPATEQNHCGATFDAVKDYLNQ